MISGKTSFARVISWLLAVATATAIAAAGQEAPSALREFAHPVTPSPPLFLAKSGQVETVVLAKAEVAVPGELEALAQWNAAGHRPLKTGFFRSLPTPYKVQLDREQLEKISSGQSLQRLSGASSVVGAQETPDGVVLAARVTVEGAWRLRLRLSDVELPTGTELWVYGDGDEIVSFGAELIRPDGDLWTPSVGGGGEINLEIRVPHEALARGETLRFDVDQVAQIYELDELGAPILDDGIPTKACTESAACWVSQADGFDLMKRATALLEIVFSGGIGQCSGTLMNPSDGSFRPYFLTAEHCLDNQNDATSTTFFFDYIPAVCGGPNPPAGSLPRVQGATLLARRPASDSSFLELFSQPGGSRGFAGWTTVAPAVGDLLRSFSHPNGRSMRFSRTLVVAQGGCNLSQSDYLFSDQELGGVQSGSSGSQVFNSQFQIVGQLSGLCGIDPSDGCRWSLNNRVDGRFASFSP